jgi:hypothetical protein
VGIRGYNPAFAKGGRIMLRQLFLVGPAVLCAAALAQAQWVTIKLPNTPRTKDGAPNLHAPAPRLRDGKTDFSGIWYEDPAHTDPERSPEGQTIGEDRSLVMVPADGAPLPLLPAAAAAADERRRRGDLTPSTYCLPHSVVDGLFVPTPFKIVHSPGLTLVLFEEFVRFQQVFTDGRGFPEDMQPAWMGYSIGRWDRDELVIETKGLNDRAVLGAGPGLLTTQTLHLTERFRRPNFGSLELRVTVDDPKTFTKTWTSKPLWFKLLPDTEFIENIRDNEKDVERIKSAR